MIKRLKVALLIRPSRRGWREFICGIAAYARPHGPWEFYYQEPEVFDRIPDWLCNWAGDGIILRIKDHRLFGQVRELGIPAIDLGGLYNDSRIRQSTATMRLWPDWPQTISSSRVSRTSLFTECPAFTTRTIVASCSSNTYGKPATTWMSFNAPGIRSDCWTTPWKSAA